MEGRGLTSGLLLATLIDILVSVWLIYPPELRISAFLVLSTPWAIALLLTFDRLSIVFRRVIEHLKGLPAAQTAFYIMLFFYFHVMVVVPLTTPLLLILAGILVAYNLAERLPARVKFPAFITFSLVVTVGFIIIAFPYYCEFTREALPNYLRTLGKTLDIMYLLAIAFGISAALADFVRLIYEGAAQYDPSVRIPTRGLRILQLIILVLLYLVIILNAELIQKLTVLMLLSLLAAWIRRRKGLVTSRKSVSMFTLVLYVLYIISSGTEYILQMSLPLVLKAAILTYAVLIIWLYLIINLVVTRK